MASQAFNSSKSFAPQMFNSSLFRSRAIPDQARRIESKDWF